MCFILTAWNSDAYLFARSQDRDSRAACCPQSARFSTFAPCLKGHLSNLTFSALTKGFHNIQDRFPIRSLWFFIYLFAFV